MLPSQGWPNPTTIFMRQAGQVDADRFPLNRFWARWADANCIWDACLQDPDWSLAMENENKEVATTSRRLCTPCTAACASLATS